MTFKSPPLGPTILWILMLLCPVLQAAEVDRLQTLLDDASDILEPQRSELQNQLQSIPDLQRATSEATQETARLRDLAAQAGRESRRMESALAVDSNEALQRWQQSLDTDAPIEALELRLQQLQVDAEKARQSLQQVTSERATLLQKPGTRTLGALQLDIATLEQRVADARRNTRADLPSRIQLAVWQAQSESRRAELERLSTELDTAGARRALLDLRQRSLRRQIDDAEKQTTLLQDLLARRHAEAMAGIQKQIAQEAETLKDGPEALTDFAKMNIDLATELGTRVKQTAAVRRQFADVVGLQERLRRALEDTESRLALGDLSEAVGAVLIRERRELPNTDRLQAEILSVQKSATEARLRQFDLNDAYNGLASSQESLQKALTEAPVGIQATEKTTESLMTTRRDLLRRLEDTVENQLDQLDALQTALTEATSTGLSLQSLLSQQLFWIPSHRPAGIAWFGDLLPGLARDLSPALWARAAQNLIDSAAARPTTSSLWLTIAAIIVMLASRAKRQSLAILGARSELLDYQFLPTLKAWLWSVVGAAPWPFLIWAIANSLRHSAEPGKFTHSLGVAGQDVAVGAYALAFLGELLHKGGMAEVIFRWSARRIKALRSVLPIGWFLLLPLQLLATLSFARGDVTSMDTAGRLWVMLAVTTLMVSIIWLLAPGRISANASPHSSRARTQVLARFLAVALTISVVMLALRGYVFSANLLLDSLAESLIWLLLVSQSHALLGRWLLIGERRLAQREVNRLREAQHEQHDQSGEAVPELSPDAVDIRHINTQTQRLLRAVSVSLLIFGLLWVWSDVLPALQKLDEIQLWRFSDVGEDGSKLLGFVTLKGLLLGIATLTLTSIAARNLPGLLEIGLLSRMNIDAASRYAISSLSRYAIVISGVILGLSWLGMRWSQLQWMAAALTVGLGFGLQEIFANFVSGIILLFERPFRVGDVITIGEFSGTVTRIRTRATTLLDFDNKEIVVPNKAFITDRLTNWTLSDTTTRVIVKVGVAYGSPVERVHQVLKQAADECPWVLAQPPARSWFMALGASALDFELRVFVATLDQRFLTMDFLNARITQLMAEATIEIAFPQVDVHLRAASLPVPPATSDRITSAT